MIRHATRGLILSGATAGILGGVAEVAWIWSYAAITGNDAAHVARAVAAAVGLDRPFISPVIGGIGIHMILAAALGIAIAVAVLPRKELLSGAGLFAAVVAALAAVWAINFFVVLPLVSPAFVTVVPYEVSLLSKLLFGVAAAWLFRSTGSIRLRLVRA